MNQWTDKISTFILQNRKWLMGIVLLTTILFCSILINVQVNNKFEIWFDDDDLTYEHYKDFKKNFGDDRSLIIIYRSDSLFSDTELSLNSYLSKRFLKIEGVKDVISLSQLRILEISPLYVVSKKLIPKRSFNRKLLKQELCAQAILIDNLLSKDGLATAIQVFPSDTSNLVNILRQAKLIIAEMPESGRFVLVGGIPLTVESARVSSQEPPAYLVAAICIMIILLFIIFRNLPTALMPVFIALVSIIWTLAIFTLFGGSVNMLTGIIPLVLLAMSIAFSIHLISSYRKFYRQSANVETAIKESCREVLLPGSIAMLTTALAFLAFSFSRIEPIRLFGLYTALGVFFSFVLSFLFLPVFFLRFGKIKVNKQIDYALVEDSFSSRITNFVTEKRKVIMFIAFLVFIISIVGLSKLQFESDQIKFFKKSNQIRVSNDIACEWFNGIYPFELVFNIETIPKDSLYEYFNLFKELEMKLLLLDHVEICHSANGFFQLVLSRNKYMITESSLFNVLESGRKNKVLENLLKHFVSENRDRYRITVKTKWINNQIALDLIRQINAEVATVFRPTQLSHYITGAAPLYAGLNDRLLNAQMISLGFSLLIIITVFIFIYRKPLLFISGILPNLFPVMNTLGIMGFLGIPMDVGTVLIASISLGVAVDDTVYFLTAYRNNRRKHSVSEALKLSYVQVWKALATTTLILIAGFCIMVFSNYKPIIYLGVFVSLNLLFALVYDFLVLPVLIFYFSKRKQK